MTSLANLSTTEGSFSFLGGEVIVNRSEDLLDDYQLEAYAKNPSSAPTCADGSMSSGPTMADDNVCFTYSP
jgi:hypothetical protein